MRREDEQTIRGFLSGETSAVSRVEKWIMAATRGYEGRLGAHREDVRQDVLVELTRLLGEGRFRGESALVSYVWQITNHACIRQVRLLSRWVKGGEGQWEERADKRQTAVERMLERDRVEGIQRIAAQLPEECRQLWRRVLGGASYQEMSAEMGLAEGTLRVRLLRCRRKAQALRESAGIWR